MMKKNCIFFILKKKRKQSGGNNAKAKSILEKLKNSVKNISFIKATNKKNFEKLNNTLMSFNKENPILTNFIAINKKTYNIYSIKSTDYDSFKKNLPNWNIYAEEKKGEVKNNWLNNEINKIQESKQSRSHSLSQAEEKKISELPVVETKEAEKPEPEREQILKKKIKNLDDYIQAATKGLKDKYNKYGRGENHGDWKERLNKAIKSTTSAATCLFNKTKHQPGKTIGEVSVFGTILILCDSDVAKCNEETYNGYIAKYQKIGGLKKEVDMQKVIYDLYPKDPITAKIILPIIPCSKGELVIMEHIKGDTFEKIFAQSLKDFKDNENDENRAKILELMKEVFKLVDKLHAGDIIHGDLHYNNIMCKVDKKTKKKKMILIDFGTARYHSMDYDVPSKAKNLIRKLLFFGHDHGRIKGLMESLMKKNKIKKEDRKRFLVELCEMDNNKSKLECMFDWEKSENNEHRQYINEYLKKNTNIKGLEEMYRRYETLAKRFKQQRSRRKKLRSKHDIQNIGWSNEDCKIVKWFVDEYTNTGLFKITNEQKENIKILTKEDYEFKEEEKYSHESPILKIKKVFSAEIQKINNVKELESFYNNNKNKTIALDGFKQKIQEKFIKIKIKELMKDEYFTNFIYKKKKKMMYILFKKKQYVKIQNVLIQHVFFLILNLKKVGTLNILK